jgi:hypothetical protein
MFHYFHLYPQFLKNRYFLKNHLTPMNRLFLNYPMFHYFRLCLMYLQFLKNRLFLMFLKTPNYH